MSPMNNRLLRPRAKGGFDPKSISGLALWLDGSTLASGLVSTWPDLSGNGRAATQTVEQDTPTTTLINGKRAVQFDTTDFVTLSCPWAASSTLFMVAVPTPTLNCFTIRSNGPSISPNIACNYSSAPSGFVWAGGNNQNITSFGSNLTGTQVLSVVHSPDVLDLYRNGALVGTVNSPTGIGTYTLNRIGFFYDKQICEIVMYHSALSQANRSAVEKYLGQKWGVAVA